MWLDSVDVLASGDAQDTFFYHLAEALIVVKPQVFYVKIVLILHESRDDSSPITASLTPPFSNEIVLFT